MRFNTSKSGDEQISLKEDVDRTREEQNDIHHITGESTCPLRRSWEICARRVLRLVDTVDECAVQQLKEFDEKKLKSTTNEGLDLGDEDEKKKLEELKAQFEPLTELKEMLGDKVEKVIVSDKIFDSLGGLTTSEDLVCKYGAHYESTGVARQLDDILHGVQRKPWRSIQRIPS